MASLLKKLRGKKSTKSVDSPISDAAMRGTVSDNAKGSIELCSDHNESAYESRYQEVIVSDDVSKLDMPYSRNFIVSDSIRVEYYKQFDNVTFDESSFTITEPRVNANINIIAYDKVITLEVYTRKDSLSKNIKGLNSLIDRLITHRDLIIKAANCTTDEDIRAIAKA